jgi:Flp pilus assembly pilin Flp
MQKMFAAFWNEENGQDMVEYSLLLGFVALSGAAVLTGLRNDMTNIWQSISASFSTATAS